MKIPTEALVKLYELGKAGLEDAGGEEANANIPMTQFLHILHELIDRRSADTTGLALADSSLLFMMAEAVIEALYITLDLALDGTDLFPPLDPAQWTEYLWHLDELLEESRGEGLCIHEQVIRPIADETIGNYASRLLSVDHGAGMPEPPPDPSVN